MILTCKFLFIFVWLFDGLIPGSAAGVDPVFALNCIVSHINGSFIYILDPYHKETLSFAFMCV